MTKKLFNRPAWAETIDWFFTVDEPPQVLGNTVFARCGKAVIGVERASGSRIWTNVIDEEAASGGFAALVGDVLVSDYMRQPENLSNVVAVSSNGMEIWRAELAGIAMPHATCIANECLYFPCMTLGSGNILVCFDQPAKNSTYQTFPLVWGATRLLYHAGHLLIANPTGAKYGRGLYRVALDGGNPTILDPGGTIELASAGQAVAAISRDSDSYRLSLYDDSFDQVWQRPVSALGLAATSEFVFAVTDGHPVCISPQTGTEHWRAALIDGEVFSITLAGGIAFFSHDWGQHGYRVSDGELVLTMPYGFGPPTYADGAFYCVGNQQIVCDAL